MVATKSTEHTNQGVNMKVLIADNHTLFREGFRSQLSRFDNVEMQEVGDYDAVKALAEQNRDFDLIFIDRDLLGTEWKDKLKALKEMFPDAKKVLLSESEEQRDILDAFELGVVGYITKLSSDSLIINALRLIMDGNLYVPPAVLKGVHRRASGEGRILSHTLPDGKNLTYRQSEVLQYLSNGLSNKQIAYEMKVSEATVKLHINALLRHLHVENRTKAVVTAQRLGILEA